MGPINIGERACSTDVIVIGAGHSGLAISRFLTRRSIDHLVLERGEVGNAWRRDRWDSLRLLTPNWMCRLPGYAYEGDDPDGYMGKDEVAGLVSAYADWIGAPVRTGTTVQSVSACGDGYRVSTDQGAWKCRAVVIASGAFNKASVPALASAVPGPIHQVTSLDYKNPGQLPEGGVLVVGASATGLQLAGEIHDSGRPVTLAVGEHVRMPRNYRGRDIQWWMLVTGKLDECVGDMEDIDRLRRLPSPQLVGTPEQSTLDLNALAERGVRLAGRLAGVRGSRAQFSGSLRNVCALADLKMNRLLASFDDWAERTGYASAVDPRQRYAPTRTDTSPVLDMDLGGGEIRSIVWATGYRPDYRWLDLPILDRKGQIRHDGGVVDMPGVFVLGLPFLRRRKSSFIHGAEDDARDISRAVHLHLNRAASMRAMRIAV
jgi:putative flavoprotein involved in K+ transport